MVVEITVIALGILILKKSNKLSKLTVSEKNESGQIICKDNACIDNNFQSRTLAIYTAVGRK